MRIPRSALLILAVAGSSDATAGTLSGLFDFAHPPDQPLLLDPSSGLPQHR